MVTLGGLRASARIFALITAVSAAVPALAADAPKPASAPASAAPAPKPAAKPANQSAAASTAEPTAKAATTPASPTKAAATSASPTKAATTAAPTKPATQPATKTAIASGPKQTTVPMLVPGLDCKTAPKYPLPLPSSLPQKDFIAYDQTLLNFVSCGHYKNLGWAHDKSIRNTGPYIDGKSYGTHPSVHIYYSPQVVAWMKAGRKGKIADGAMIIKEQLGKTPAAQYDGNLNPVVSDWTIMLKDSKGSNDGWYWAEVYTGPTPASQMVPNAVGSFKPPFTYPNSGFGHYCLNCHASAAQEHTFSALNNVQGFPGEPLAFRVDQSWRKPATPPASAPLFHQKAMQAPHVQSLPPVAAPSSDFLTTFKSITAVPFGEVQKMVPEAYDRVVSAKAGPGEFLSSDQCLGCHGAISGSAPTMFLATATGGINVSPYGEWRWSPMGLAGRDPIFHAQLESELAYIRSIPDKKTAQSLEDTAVNTCFRCHGVMGKRQWDLDTKCDPTNPVKPCNPANPALPQFKPDFVQIEDSKNPHFKYGALARDGVSCLACHRTQETQQPPGKQENSLRYFLEHATTGLFQTGGPKQLIGPFKSDEISPLPMENALGITPKGNDYIKSSRLCGACHTIYLPVIDKPPVQPVGKGTHFNMEQATYLEWLNSSFQNEVKPFAACKPNDPSQACAQSCQDCHMSGGYHNKANGLSVEPIQTKFAVIEDQDFPQADHRAPLDKINVRFREKDFKRHELLGLNAFLLEMFKQNNTVLGVGLADYMSGSTTDLSDAIDNVVLQAQNKTARIETSVVSASAEKLVANVKVTNLVGHRLPSGVGFRRAFIEFLVLDSSSGQPRVVWSSGRTNRVGVIVDDEGKPLPSEFFEEYTDKDGKTKQYFQQHHDVITSPGQVQIYEELTQNAEGKFTTSFLRRDHDEIKDNRLLPQGWTKTGPDPKNFDGVYLEATFPKGRAASDPAYQDGSGTDSLRYEVALPKGLDPKYLSVRATLYYQAIPPYFLNMRFKEVPNGPATKRLYYLASNLKTDGTAIQDWKLRIVGAEVKAAP